MRTASSPQQIYRSVLLFPAMLFMCLRPSSVRSDCRLVVTGTFTPFPSAATFSFPVLFLPLPLPSFNANSKLLTSPYSPPPSTELDDPSAKAYVSSPRFPFFSLSSPSAALPLSPKPHVVNSCSARPPSAAFQITKETRCVYRLLCRILFGQRPHCRRLACRCTL